MIGRKPNGQFSAGNKFGKGRTPDHFKAAVVKAVSARDLREITLKLVAAAKEGDIKAATLLFEKLFGKVETLFDSAGAGLEAEPVVKIVFADERGTQINPATGLPVGQIPDTMQK